MSQTTREERQLLIGGKWVDAEGGTYEIVNPATEEVVGLAPEASVGDAQAAAAAARDALPGWAATPADERLALMAKAAGAIRAKAPELLPLVIAETGATAAVGSKMQVPVAADRFERYSRDLRAITQRSFPPQVAMATPLAPGGLVSALALRQPVGVAACITSYNFPMVNMAGKVAPALAMGNTVVVKPAPQDPLAVIELVRILDEVGFPPGVVNLVVSSQPTPASALVDSPDVDMVSFTGSTQVGVRIAEAGARTMKRLLLELGGKGACLVFDDADVKGAVGCIGSTWSFHSGQICTAPTRAVVHRGVLDQVVERLGGYAGALKVGDPTDTATVVGPLISAAQRERVEGYIATGRKEGAEVVAGGGRPVGLDKGFYIEPTLLTGTNDMTVVRDEIFGPVVVVVPFDDEDEGIAIANDSEFGLYDYVFTADTARAFRVGKQLRAGHVGINTAQRHHDAPFGGFKMSGVGRDGGDYGLEAYSELQSIVW
ncbi:MAG TPA: aldehyde dehydrogenase family protein, partial [Acidimicrobiales bacterium]|nr:aldehyde dehydrogenase family protein [Acidimicrobiales bacterium]